MEVVTAAITSPKGIVSGDVVEHQVNVLITFCKRAEKIWSGHVSAAAAAAATAGLALIMPSTLLGAPVAAPLPENE